MFLVCGYSSEMRVIKVVRRWLWRRLERRVNAAVDARFELALRRAAAFASRPDGRGGAMEIRLADQLAEVERRLQETTGTAKEARRLALEASRAIERILQAEVEMWQAFDMAERR